MAIETTRIAEPETLARQAPKADKTCQHGMVVSRFGFCSVAAAVVLAAALLLAFGRTRSPTRQMHTGCPTKTGQVRAVDSRDK